MKAPAPYAIETLGSSDLEPTYALLELFGEAFGQKEVYCAERPSPAYLRRLLGSEGLIVLAALRQGKVIGGLAACELIKFEQQRSEIYLYDLAVAEAHRRQGVATQLIRALQKLAASRGAWTVFVQTDHGDEAAIALYSKLGIRKKALHFDLSREPASPEGLTARSAQASDRAYRTARSAAIHPSGKVKLSMTSSAV